MINENKEYSTNIYRCFFLTVAKTDDNKSGRRDEYARSKIHQPIILYFKREIRFDSLTRAFNQTNLSLYYMKYYIMIELFTDVEHILYIWLLCTLLINCSIHADATHKLIWNDILLSILTLATLVIFFN